MHIRIYKFILLASVLFSPVLAMADGPPCPELLDVDVRPLLGKDPVKLCEQYRGKVLLIVNTASKCAYTYQYEGLEALYRKYRDRGLVVLGFPSNDFGNQEPGTEKQIQSFCRLTYGVGFPMFEKSRVTSFNADPLYRKLGEAAGEYPKWNFHKYLLDRNGRLVASFASNVEPGGDQVISKIETILSADQ